MTEDRSGPTPTDVVLHLARSGDRDGAVGGRSQIALSEKRAEHRLGYRTRQNLQIEFVCPYLGTIMHNLSSKYGCLRPYTMPSFTRMARIALSYSSQQRQH